jgi:hypothetical protein
MNNRIVLSVATASVLCYLYYSKLTTAAETGLASPSSEVLPVAATVSSKVTEVSTRSFASSTQEQAMLRPKRTVRKFSNNQPQTIECKLGTKLFFPPGTFVYPSGDVVSGEVRLVVEECYNLNEMLAAKLSTTAGDRRLETAGMIQLHAYAGNTQLRLADQARYNIYFPVDENRKEDFELFYGSRNEQGIIDWRLDEQSDPISESVSVSEPIINDCFVQISASQFRYGNNIHEMDYFNWPLQNGQNLNQWFVSNFNPDAAMLDDFCARRMYAQLAFRLNEDGTLKDYYIAHSSRVDYDRLLASTLQTMPPIDMKRFMPKYTEDHTCILSFGRQQRSSSAQFIERFKKRFDYADPDKKLEAVSTEDLNYYIFSSTELGWINCDRFIREEEPLVDFTVDAAGCENTTVSMVFDKDKSILAGIKLGNQFLFKGVPANQKVRIITIDNPNGKPRMEELLQNTSNAQCSVRNMKPITLADLDVALCWN